MYFCCSVRLDDVVWSTCPGVTALSLRLLPSHQILPLTGHATAVSFSCGELKTCGFIGWRRAHFTPLCLCRVKRCLLQFDFSFIFFFKLCLSSADVDLDAVVLSTEKLSHPTVSRPRVTDRRPRSQIITPVSLNWSAGCHGSKVNILMACVVCLPLCSPSWPAWTWTRLSAKTKERKNHSLCPELRRPR